MLSKVLLPYSFGVKCLCFETIRGPFHHAKLPNTIPYQIPVLNLGKMGTEFITITYL